MVRHGPAQLSSPLEWKGGIAMVLARQNTRISARHSVIVSAGVVLFGLSLSVGLRLSRMRILQVGLVVLAPLGQLFGQSKPERGLLILSRLLREVFIRIRHCLWLKLASAGFP